MVQAECEIKIVESSTDSDSIGQQICIKVRAISSTAELIASCHDAAMQGRAMLVDSFCACLGILYGCLSAGRRVQRSACGDGGAQ